LPNSQVIIDDTGIYSLNEQATVLQMATMYTAMGGTLLNIGVTLNSQGNQIIANGSFIGAGRFLFLLH
jgi:hypothetical protein